MHQKRTRRGRITSALCMAIICSGCGASSGATTTADDAAADGTAEQPIQIEGTLDAYIRSRVGHSTGEISSRQRELILSATLECMDGTGFSSDEVSSLVENEAQVDVIKPSIGAGSATSWAIASLQMYQTTIEANPGRIPSAELEALFYDCEAEAIQNTPDLIEPLYQQLNTALDEHNSRVKADPRFGSAESEFESCQQQYGYTTETYLAKKTNIHEEASAILERVANGELSSADALAQVQALNQQELKTLGDVEECELRYNTIVAEVSDEVDVAIIEANAATFDEIFAQLNAALEQLDSTPSGT